MKDHNEVCPGCGCYNHASAYEAADCALFSRHRNLVVDNYYNITTPSEWKEYGFDKNELILEPYNYAEPDVLVKDYFLVDMT